LIQETQDAGETIAPSAAIDTVETKPMDKTSKLSKHVHELITTATQERDQLKIATKALQTSLARAARDNQSLADDRVELRTENRLLKQQLTQLTAINKESDQVIAEQPTRTEKPLSDSQAASTLPTQQASRSAPDTGNAAVNHKPRPVAGNPKPHYPLLARNQGIEGRVVVNVLVSAQGTVKTISVGQSSGSRLLDKAALQTVKKWRFHPVLHNGKAVPSSETVPVVFKLKDS
jgi:protein TonB